VRTEDGCIINKCLNGEPEAFGLLVDKYKAGIYAYVYNKLRDFHDAQDVTQEVFLQAYRNLHTLRRWESFVFWLYRIAFSYCERWIREQSKRPDREFIDDQDPKTLEAPSLSSYRDNKAIESLREALDSLSEGYREVLTLHYFGGMNSKEIAMALGTSHTAIRHRLSRARIRLKEEMLAMVKTTFEQQRLQATFTFRIVEAVKRIRIHPMPKMTALPWGLSLATGIIITILSFNPHTNLLNPFGAPGGSPLPCEAKVLKIGEIPGDVLKTSNVTILSSQQGNSNGAEPNFLNLQNALFMAPQGQGDTWTKKADLPIAIRNLSSSSPVVNGKLM